MMRLRMLVIFGVALVLAQPALAQQPSKPGPEHEKLRKLEGTWEATIKAGGSESKGTVTYKMELGGLWLVSNFEGEFGGDKFQGKGMDTFDARKKKYVSVWADSMSTTPLVMEGTFDNEGKILTMTGEATGQDGNLAKVKTTSEMKDNDTMEWTMSMADKDGKETMAMSITYKRKK